MCASSLDSPTAFTGGGVTGVTTLGTGENRRDYTKGLVLMGGNVMKSCIVKGSMQGFCRDSSRHGRRGDPSSAADGPPERIRVGHRTFRGGCA